MLPLTLGIIRNHQKRSESLPRPSNRLTVGIIRGGATIIHAQLHAVENLALLKTADNASVMSSAFKLETIDFFTDVFTASKSVAGMIFRVEPRQLLGAIFLLYSNILPACSGSAETPSVHFHQSQIEAWRSEAGQFLNNEQMMDLVFSALPEKITVYPSEGYYYFNFIANKSDMRGNIRFGKDLIQEGSIAFMLYRRRADGEDKDIYYQELNKSPLFSLTRLSEREFSLFYKGRTTSVYLHDQKSDAPFVAEKSEYSFGELLDDSGEVFHLVFNSSANILYYIWSQQYGISEKLDDSFWYKIKIGTRTGFVYIMDPLGRYILVGVNNQQVQQNSHFDGPFDQLPDRKIDFARLHEAILKSDPKYGARLKPGSVDFSGSKENRYAILSYIIYNDISEFKVLRRCGRYTNLQNFVSCVSRAIKRSR